MKKSYMKKGVLSLLLTMLVTLAFCQNATIQGTVYDENKQTLPGASIFIKPLNKSVGTNEDGHFLLPNLAAGTYTLMISFIGYESREENVTLSGANINLTIQLKPNAEGLDEVVVIGYGTQKKGELTGSVTTLNSKDFQKGVITSPDQLISGKAAGVQITPSGGRPGAGSTIRIRAGASLNASNDPLIVIDGVPLSSFKNDRGDNILPGTSNPLSLINPNDIETFTVLKDANATAIYGSRASNGVILITTKKGASGKPTINFSTQNSIATIANRIDVLSPQQFRDYVIANAPDTTIAKLGDANTDWQKEIFRAAFATDNNLSIGGTYKFLPYRVGVGYLNQQGILKRDDMNRTSLSVSLNPKFFDNHLKVDLNLKGSMQRANFGNQDAIFTALQFDPTRPVYAENAFGNYYEWTQGAIPHPLAPRNPVGLIDLKKDHGKVNRSFGNLQLDYSFHFLPELHANLNLGYDISRGQGGTDVPAFAAMNYTTGGRVTRFLTDIDNRVGEFFLNYNKTFNDIASNFDITAGYGYYDYKTTTNNYPVWRADGTILTTPPFAFDVPQNRLISYYGRVIYTLNDKYILSGTARTDGSSRFSPDNRWGFFPSAGLTWRMKKETFLENATALSSLNLRLSYGVTGQQDGIANYSYLANYYQSVNEAQYQFGNQFYPTFSPIAYDQDIQWESTSTYNGGIDYGFLEGRINGSIDVYYKKTKDLLSVIPIPIGTNFSNLLLTNVGNMENRGVELNINAIAMRKQDFSWDMNFNFTYNHNKVTNLTAVDDPNYFTQVGNIEGGTGQNVQAHVVGHSPFTYRLYQQVYDDNGKPLEGVYADLNGDGTINDLDRQLNKSPLPKYILGFTTNFVYKKWTLNAVLRSNIGNYVYDNVSSNMAIRNNVLNPTGLLNNAPVDLLNSDFTVNNALSDYYLHDASFLRMDNAGLTYAVGKLFSGSSANLSISANVQNVFTITKYHGVDPEIQSGIDNRFYPRPRTFVLGLNLGF